MFSNSLSSKRKMNTSSLRNTLLTKKILMISYNQTQTLLYRQIKDIINLIMAHHPREKIHREIQTR